MGWFWLGNIWLLIGLLANHSSDTILVIRYWSLGEARVVVAGDFLELWFGRGRNIWSEFTFREKEIVFLHINFQFFGIPFYEILSILAQSPRQEVQIKCSCRILWLLIPVVQIESPWFVTSSWTICCRTRWSQDQVGQSSECHPCQLGPCRPGEEPKGPQLVT